MKEPGNEAKVYRGGEINYMNQISTAMLGDQGINNEDAPFELIEINIR